MDPYEIPPDNLEDAPLIALSCGKHFVLSCGLPIMGNCLECRDGTAGHSKGNWHYYGDVFAGIKTTCQHPYPPPDIKSEGVGLFVWTSHKHEDDDIIPAITEETHYANPDQTTTWEDYLANLRLMALAQHAPHDCGDPECPGVINKRKLELYDKFQAAINAFNEAGLLT